MIIYVREQRRRYGFFHALFDIFMTFITGGLWIIWLIIKYLRTH